MNLNAIVASALLIVMGSFFSIAENLFAQNTSTDNPVTETSDSSSDQVIETVDTDSITPLLPFSYVISADQLQIYSDRTIAEAVTRFPGIQRGHRGQFNIRGVGGAGRGLYNVNLDGQRMATTGKGHRSIDLGSISADLAGQLEIVKVMTPDRDADALGGLININTRRLAGQQRQFHINYGGGFDTKFGEYISPERRASVHYADTFGDGFTVSAGLTHQLNNEAWESLGIGYEVTDFGNGNVDVIEGISPGFNANVRSNWDGHIALNYQLSDISGIFMNSYFNNSSLEFTRHNVNMSAQGDWISQFETGAVGRRGTYGYNLYIQEQKIQQFMARAGVEHKFNTFDLDYSFGWSNSNLLEDQISLPFLLTGLDYTINMADQTRPAMEMINGQVRSQDLRIQPMNEIVQEHTDNIFTGNINVSIPMGTALIRVGSGAILGNKDGIYRDTIFRVLGLVNLSGFEMDESKDFSVLNRNEYAIPWYLEPDNARRYFDFNQPTFRRETELQRQNSDIWNYEAAEGIYSGYGMGTWNFGSVNIMAGVRIEHTIAEYTGNNVLFSNIGFHVSTTDTTVSNSYTNIFPSVQAGISPTDRSSVNFAYSRTISRPDFHDLTPFMMVNVLNGTIFKGNPRLDPMVSDNLDLFLGYDLGNTGNVSFGVFYKRLTNFVFERFRVLEGGEFDGYSEHTFEVGDETAAVYGAEVSWSQNLSFLPGMLRNFGIHANYTWSHSEFEVDFREDAVRLPGQSPHIVNAALNYRQGRFTGQVAYHWTAESLVYIADTQTPSTEFAGQIYRDRYNDGVSDLSASVRFRLSDNFRLWMDATNLLGDDRIQYTHSRSSHPVETDFRRSSVIRLGLRFDL